MTRKKLLWLCSWYPSRTDPFNGDFIQRHARAAALYNDIYVIHAAVEEQGEAGGSRSEIIKGEGLTEHILYFKKKASLAGRLLAHFRWSVLVKKAIRAYIRENGLPGLVHVQVPMRAGLPAMWMKRKYKVPYLVTEHWGIYNEVEVLNYEGRSALFKKLTKSIFGGAASFISVSRYLAEGVNRLVLKKEYQVIPNVVDTRLFYYKSRSAEAFRFIHVSNMVPLKNTEGILRAFKQLIAEIKEAELVMVGNPDDSISRLAFSIGLPVDKVIFKGELPYPQVAAEMQAAASLVLFSNIENSPCVIGEALCCGLPVIATRTGGIPELLSGENGVLVTPGAEDELVSAMRQLIMNFAQYDREKIAEAARGKFSYEVVGLKMDEIYSDVLA
ncbi:MAG: glycosyltransferase [Sphingobacteriales bacterium]|nr:glycosyltransferase [Sphingobacteriales bacterium]